MPSGESRLARGAMLARLAALLIVVAPLWPRPVHAAPSDVDTFDNPHLWEGAERESYWEFLEQRRAIVLALLGGESAISPDRRKEAVAALGEIAEMARFSQSDEAVCHDLDSILDGVRIDAVVRIHTAPLRGHASAGLDAIEPKAISLLTALYREQAVRCSRLHGSGNAHSIKAREREAGLIAAIRATPPIAYAPANWEFEHSLDPDYDDDFLDHLGPELTVEHGLAASLLIRARQAVTLGEYALAELYVKHALVPLHTLDPQDRTTQLLLVQIFRLDNITGDYANLWSPELDTIALEETAQDRRCTRTLYRHIDSGLSIETYLDAADHVDCDQYLSEWEYEFNAALIHGSRFRYMSAYAPGRLGELAKPLALLHAVMRAKQDRLQREFDLRAVVAASDTETLGLVSQSYLDALWYGKADKAASSADDMAFRLIQFLNDRENDDAMLKNAANRFAASNGKGALVAELEALNAVDYSDAVISGGTGPASDSDEAWEEFADHAMKLERRSEVLTELQESVPTYFDILNPQPLSLDEVKEMLGPDEAVFAITTSRLGTHGFVVTSDAHHWVFRTDSALATDRAATRLLWDVFADVAVPEDVDSFWASRSDGKNVFSRDLAHRLYQQTLGQHEALLVGKTRLFTLTNTGGLAKLPFALLVAETPQGSDSDPDDLRGTTWLAERYELGKLPTLQTLKLLRGRRGPDRDQAKDAIFGIGDPALGGSAQDRGATDRRQRRAQLRTARELNETPFLDAARRMSRLPGTRKELQSIAAAFGQNAATILMGDDATELALRESDVGEARLLVFATHGVMAGQLGGLDEAALILSPNVGPGVPDASVDGVLTASEIASLDLAAQWAVLSACNTATGEGTGAPGLSGLSRAFFYAGVESILASLWPVDDEISPVLTVGTITGQRQRGISRGAALRAAMRTVRSDRTQDGAAMSFAHPMYWAPFVLIGDVAD